MAMEGDERFANALDDCCTRVRDGETLGSCLAHFPAEYRQDLARLVPLTSRLAELRSDPTAEFRVRLERELVGSIDRARTSRQSGLLGRLGRLFPTVPLARAAATALVVLVILAGSGIGVVGAADDSLPDSPLYQVKTAREWVALALAQNDEARVGVHAAQIGERGRELARAVRAGKTEPVLEVLGRRLGTSIDRMVDQALQLRAQGRREPSLRALVALRVMQRELDRLISQASPAARPTLQKMRTYLEQQERRLMSGGRIVG